MMRLQNESAYVYMVIEEEIPPPFKRTSILYKVCHIGAPTLVNYEFFLQLCHLEIGTRISPSRLRHQSRQWHPPS